MKQLIVLERFSLSIDSRYLRNSFIVGFVFLMILSFFIARGRFVYETNETLRMGLNVSGPISRFDPQTVYSTVDAHLARNLYSRLIGTDDDGQITSDLAESFVWDGSSYIFTLRDLKTIDGHVIDVDDVYLSLLRIIRNDQSTHGSLRDYLCDDHVANRAAPCRGMKIKNGKLVLTPIRPESHSFLLLLLASVDMSIIPKNCLDQNSLRWDILDYRNTTGLYYVDYAGERGSAVWKINPNHYKYQKSNFAQIEIIPVTTGSESLKAFAQGKIDFLPTAAGIKKNDIDRFGSDIAVHTTYPIQLIPAAFTAKGHQLSKTDRLIIGANIKLVMRHRANPDNGVETNQMFPAQSEGMLDSPTVSEYQAFLMSHAHLKPSRKVRVAVGASLYDDLKLALATLPWLIVERVTELPFSRPIEDQPELTVLPGDTSFYESLTMIHYYFSVGAFGPIAAGSRWLEEYVAIPDKADRLLKLRQLHKKLLMNGDIVPLYISNYYAIGRSRIEMEISKFFAGTPMWKVHHK